MTTKRGTAYTSISTAELHRVNLLNFILLKTKTRRVHNPKSQRGRQESRGKVEPAQ